MNYETDARRRSVMRAVGVATVALLAVVSGVLVFLAMTRTY